MKSFLLLLDILVPFSLLLKLGVANGNGNVVEVHTEDLFLLLGAALESGQVASLFCSESVVESLAWNFILDGFPFPSVQVHRGRRIQHCLVLRILQFRRRHKRPIAMIGAPHILDSGNELLSAGHFYFG